MEGVLVIGLAAAVGSLLGALTSAFAVIEWLKRHPRQVDQVGVAQVADAVAERVAAMRDQAWFWTPEWQAGEREADADIAAGRVIRHATTDDFLASLDRVPPATSSPAK